MSRNNTNCPQKTKSSLSKKELNNAEDVTSQAVDLILLTSLFLSSKMSSAEQYQIDKVAIIV